MRQNTSRNPGRTDTDLELERRGKMSDLTAEERSAFILVAERLGCTTAAQHIRDDQRRRDRVHAAPPAAPRPGPKPRPTPPRAPMMMVVPEAPEPTADGAVLDALVEQLDQHAESPISPRLRAALADLRSALAGQGSGSHLRTV